MIQLDHEEEQPVPMIPFLGASYAKDCIPLENKCNVTGVTGEGSVGSGASPRSDGAKPRHHQPPIRSATLRRAESAPPTMTDKSWPQTKSRSKPEPRSLHRSAAVRTARSRSNRPRARAK